MRPTLTPLTSAKFPDRAFVLTLPSERRLAGADVEVLEDGEPVASPSLAPADSLGNTAFASVLVIDASKSMRGDAIAGAMAAARAFAGRRKLEQRLGVIVFNKRAVTALPLTADQAEIDAALSSAPRLEGGTAIHEAALAGVDMLREARIAGGSVVLLSDGADTSKAAGLPDVVGAARRAGVRVFTVGLESARVPARDARGARVRHRRRLRAGVVAAVARRHLRPARRDAQQPVPAPLPLLRPPARARDARGPRPRRGAGDVDLHEPGARARARAGLPALGLGRAVALAGRRRPRGRCWAGCSSARSRSCCSAAAATACSSG